MNKPTLLSGLALLPAIMVGLPTGVSADPYLDLGTGSIAIQMLIAGFVGGLFAAKLYWGRIKKWFRNLTSNGRGREDTRD